MLAQRLEFIVEQLEKNGSVEVSALSKLCGVTEKTIRQDLIKLEQLKIAVRVHGGAMILKGGSEIYPVVTRKVRHADEKQKIARAALELIEEGDTIFLDTGTTTLELAKILNKRVIVITNDPFIAGELLNNELVTLYVAGGRLKRDRGSYAYVGQDTLRTIQNYRAKKCFLGGSAFDFEQGLMMFSTDEVDVKRAIMKAAQEVICMIDASKFHQIAFVSYARLEEIDHFVTDDRIGAQDVAWLEEHDVKVTVAK